MAGIAEVLHGGPVDASEIQRVRDLLLYEQPGLQQRLVKFWALLILAAAISTYGLLADSVASVIGAMIVAPLMLPIMGLAFSISIADRKAILSSIAVGLSGVFLAVAVGYLLTFAFRTVVDPTQNVQIMSRTAPRVIDLLAALATGLAGAFAIGRKDVSDTLPGVAIAISLVPPLANVGILLATGNPMLAWGSMLLFITNYLAIVLTGTFMFALMRFPHSVLTEKSPRARNWAIVTVAVATALVFVPLAATSSSAIVDNMTQTNVTTAAEAWVRGTGFRLVSVTPGSTVQVVISGSGQAPPTAALQQRLRGKVFGRPVSVETVPTTREAFATK